MGDFSMTTMRTRTVRFLGVVSCAVALTVASAGMANATVGMGGPPPSSGTPTSGTPTSGSPSSSGGDYGSSGPSYGTVSNCSVVSTPNYIGLSCGSGGARQQTVGEYFGVKKVEKLPGCSHKPLGQSELDALQYENTPGPEGTTWYWEYCLVDPKLDEPVRQVQINVSIVWIRNDQNVEVHQEINDLVDLQNGVVPFPVAVATPSSRPRVGAWTSFVNGTDDHLTVAAGGVTLDAHVVGLTIKPLGENKPPTVSCAGTGLIAQRGDTPQPNDDGCWWKYDRSSSGQPLTTSQGEPAYPVEITATWAVDTVVGGVRSRFNTFQKSQVTPLPVTEIQALVIN
jgi:hypothetical protein